jgi:hypothetical protein
MTTITDFGIDFRRIAPMVGEHCCGDRHQVGHRTSLTLQRHLQNMLFYHKGLRVRKTLLPFVACARKAVILRVRMWSAHESDVVGLIAVRKRRICHEHTSTRSEEGKDE